MDYAGTMRSGYERLSAGDLAGFGDLLAEDLVEHEETPGFAPTKEGTLAFFEMLRGAFPDLKMSVEDLLADGTKTVARVTVTGTHRGDFMGVPPSGKSVVMQVIDIMRFDDSGRVCEHWGAADMLALMQQIGAVPDGPA